ncbi:hypothetical protein AWB77_01448 [Caballeronia fortuita]|uniref:Uncharacterized protein n=1 Tax=Caballeronia fortuita TaxID=1777138 RepID=A0A158A7J7_9BURK|nr:hypothetical protein AWB77_01448 [Caballeronia fortuita]
MRISGSAPWDDEKAVLASFEQSYSFSRLGLDFSALTTMRREIRIRCTLVVSAQGHGTAETFRHSPLSLGRCLSRPAADRRQQARADRFPFLGTARSEHVRSSLHHEGRAALLATDSTEDAAARANNGVACVLNFRIGIAPYSVRPPGQGGEGKRFLSLASAISLSAQSCLSAFVNRSVKRASTTRQHGRFNHRDMKVDAEGRGWRRGPEYGDRLRHGLRRSLS